MSISTLYLKSSGNCAGMFDPTHKICVMPCFCKLCKLYAAPTEPRYRPMHEQLYNEHRPNSRTCFNFYWLAIYVLEPSNGQRPMQLQSTHCTLAPALVIVPTQLSACRALRVVCTGMQDPQPGGCPREIGVSARQGVA